MVMNHQKTGRLKPLLDKVPPGFLVDTSWLKAQGIDPKSIHDYVTRGWLKRVIRSVYRRPLPEGVQEGSEAEWQIPVLSLQRILDYDVHVGGETALDLAGYSHYLSLGTRPRVYLYGDVPPWLKRLPIKTKFVVHSRTLFGGELTGISDAAPDRGSGTPDVQSQTVNIWPLAVSTTAMWMCM